MKYSRNLPHWHPDGATFFVTWKLQGAQLKSKHGPFWLADPQVAQVVSEEILRAQQEGRIEDLAAWVVMPNHVHVLLKPREELLPVLTGMKGASARRANLLLNRQGRFWQQESFDRWIRDGREFDRFRYYIEHNPVSARLVEKPADWRWSSAGWAEGGGLKPASTEHQCSTS